MKILHELEDSFILNRIEIELKKILLTLKFIANMIFCAASLIVLSLIAISVLEIFRILK